MNRRMFVRFLAALPFIGRWFKPAKRTIAGAASWKVCGGWGGTKRK